VSQSSGADQSIGRENSAGFVIEVTFAKRAPRSLRPNRTKPGDATPPRAGRSGGVCQAEIFRSQFDGTGAAATDLEKRLIIQRGGGNFFRAGAKRCEKKIPQRVSRAGRHARLIKRN